MNALRALTVALAILALAFALHLHRAERADYGSQPLSRDVDEAGAVPRREGALARASEACTSGAQTPARKEALENEPVYAAVAAPTTAPRERKLLVAGKVEARTGERLLFSRVVVERVVLDRPRVDDTSLEELAGAETAQRWRVGGLSGLPARDGTFAIEYEEPLDLGHVDAVGPLDPRSVFLQLTATARDHRRASVRFEPGQRDVRLLLDPVGHLELETGCEPQFEGTTLRLRVVDADGVEFSEFAKAGKKARIESLALGFATLEVSLSHADTTLVTLRDVQVRQGVCTDQRLQPLSLHGRMELRNIHVTCSGLPLNAKDGVSLFLPGHTRSTGSGFERTAHGLRFVAVVGSAPVGSVQVHGYRVSEPAPLTEGLHIDLVRDRIVEVTLGPPPASSGVYGLQAESLEDEDGLHVESEVSRAPGSATAYLRNPPVGKARVRLVRRTLGGTDGSGPVVAEGPWHPVVLPGPPHTRVALDVSH